MCGQGRRPRVRGTWHHPGGGHERNVGNCAQPSAVVPLAARSQQAGAAAGGHPDLDAAFGRLGAVRRGRSLGHAARGPATQHGSPPARGVSTGSVIFGRRVVGCWQPPLRLSALCAWPVSFSGEDSLRTAFLGCGRPPGHSLVQRTTAYSRVSQCCRCCFARTQQPHWLYALADCPWLPVCDCDCVTGWPKSSVRAVMTRMVSGSRSSRQRSPQAPSGCWSAWPPVDALSLQRPASCCKPANGEQDDDALDEQ